MSASTPQALKGIESDVLEALRWLDKSGSFYITPQGMRLPGDKRKMKWPCSAIADHTTHSHEQVHEALHRLGRKGLVTFDASLGLWKRGAS